MRTSRVHRYSRLFVGVVLLVSFLSIGGAGASEGDLVQETVEVATQPLTGPVEEVVGEAAEVVGEAAEVVGEAAETVTGGSEAVEETTTAVSETATESVQAVSDSVEETAGAAAGTNDDTAGAAGGAGSAPGGARDRDERSASSRAAGPGSERRRPEASSPALSQEGRSPSEPRAGLSGSCPNGIDADCLLDVLYGAASTAPEVLGTLIRNLALTGLGLAALVGVALLAFSSGGGALMWSARRDRSRAAPA